MLQEPFNLFRVGCAEDLSERTLIDSARTSIHDSTESMLLNAVFCRAYRPIFRQLIFADFHAINRQHAVKRMLFTSAVRWETKIFVFPIGLAVLLCSHW